MKLEVGKEYRARDGRKVGPMRSDVGLPSFPWDGVGSHQFYKDDGRADDGREYDLIAPWPTEPTGPVRTVTRTTREIVPGDYDGLEVGRAVNGMVFLAMPIANHGQESIDALIANLSAIRDALEDN